MTELNKRPTVSNFKFGQFFSILFLITSVVLFYNSYIISSGFFAIIFIFFCYLTITRSKILTPLNKAWMLLGLTLGRIISPIVLGLIFFILVTPVSLFFRAIKRDELRLRKSNKKSFWIARHLKKISTSSFKDQF